MHRRTYGILAIARRHPMMLYHMLCWNKVDHAALHRDMGNEWNRVF